MTSYDGLRAEELSLGAELHRGSLGRLSAATLGEKAVARLLGTTHGASERARRCVVRTLGPEASAGADHVSMVRRESDIGVRTLSPHVVRHFAVQAGTAVFSAMELVDGLTLAALVERARSRAELVRSVTRIGVDVLTGLAALHALTDDAGRNAGVVHQAPAARHILVGADGVARIADLTLAVGLEHRSMPALSARLRPHEMAPEQAFAPEHVDPRCDVFIACGAIWQGLTGHPLFAQAAPDAALQRMLRMAIPSFAELGVPVAASVERVLLRGLERSRRARAGSARELAAELEIVARAAGHYAEREEVAELVGSLQRARALPATFGEPVLWERAAPPQVHAVAPPAVAQPAVATPAPSRPAGTLLGYAALPPEAQAVLRAAGLRLPGEAAPVVVERPLVIDDEPIVELSVQRTHSAPPPHGGHAASLAGDSRFWTLPEPAAAQYRPAPASAEPVAREPWLDLPAEPRPRLGLGRGLVVAGLAAALLGVALWAELSGRGDERARALQLPGPAGEPVNGPRAPSTYPGMPSRTGMGPGPVTGPGQDVLEALLAEFPPDAPRAEPSAAGPSGGAPSGDAASAGQARAARTPAADVPALRRRPRAAPAEPPPPAARTKPGRTSAPSAPVGPAPRDGPLAPSGNGLPASAKPDEPLGSNPYD